MPITFPTSTLYRWATNALNRSAPTDPEKVTGFRGGDPVPPLQVNDIVGTISDWVDWVGRAAFRDSNALSIIPSALGTWYIGDRVGPDTGSGLQFTTIGEANIERASTGGTTAEGQLWASSMPLPFGGVLEPPIATVQNLSGGSVVGTNSITVQAISQNGGSPALAVWDGSVTTSGDLTLTLNGGSTTLPNDGTNVDLSGPFLLRVTLGAGANAGDGFRLGALALNFQ